MRSDFSQKRIWITGHTGMLGSALVRSLRSNGANFFLTSRKELDLTDRDSVLSWMRQNQPQWIFHVAAKVGGIQANAMFPADFLSQNLQIQTNVIDGAHQIGAEKLVFVASNCIYPQGSSGMIGEDALLQGAPEATIKAYAISKIAGIELCRAYQRQHGRNFISVVPPNLYGTGDNYNSQNNHVVAGIMRRAHEAAIANCGELIIWGDGTPRREILHVDDAASALKHVMLAETQHDLYNIGCGHDLTITEIAQTIAEVVGFKGRLVYDATKPNGTMRKLLDNRRISALGWRAIVSEKAGLRSTYSDFLQSLDRTVAARRGSGIH